MSRFTAPSTAPDVLAVDDDAVFLMLLGRRVRDSGLSLETCSSAQEALARLRETRVRLLLVDLRMEGMGGLDLIAALRAEGGLGAMRTRIVTAAVPEATLLERIEASGAELLLKEEALVPGAVARLHRDAR